MFVSTNVDDLVVLSAFFAMPGRRPSAIVLGQFLGIAALVLVSMGLAFAALTIPSRWIAVLGLAPIAIGVRQLLASRSDDGGDDNQKGSSIWPVAAVTIANGGDNLGVYVPVFAHQPSAIPIDAIVFAVMTAVWCLAAWVLTSQQAVQSRLQRYGRRILPWVLIVIGAHILWGLA